jgi:hypothetical protein
VIGKRKKRIIAKYGKTFLPIAKRSLGRMAIVWRSFGLRLPGNIAQCAWSIRAGSSRALALASSRRTPGDGRLFSFSPTRATSRLSIPVQWRKPGLTPTTRATLWPRLTRQSHTPPSPSLDLPILPSPAVGRWLLFSSALVFGIIVVGGVTRLTESGLSITEWRPITGILPPLRSEEWSEEFEKYRATPEFKL